MGIMRTKKALSDIIATVLLVLLVVAAAAALVAFLKPYVMGNLTQSSECLPYRDYYQFQQSFQNDSGEYNYNCYVQNGAQVLIGSMVISGENLSQNDLSNLQGFDIVFSDGQNSETATLANGNPVNKTVGGVWRIDQPNDPLQINNPKETLTYVYNSSRVYTTADVYPILDDGRTCDKTDSITLRPCSGVGLS